MDIQEFWAYRRQVEAAATGIAGSLTFTSAEATAARKAAFFAARAAARAAAAEQQKQQAAEAARKAAFFAARAAARTAAAEQQKQQAAEAARVAAEEWQKQQTAAAAAAAARREAAALQEAMLKEAASLKLEATNALEENQEHHALEALEPRQGEEQPVLQEVVDPGQGEEHLSSVAATQTDGAVKKQSSPEGMEKLQKERAKCAAVVAAKPVGMQVQLNNWKQQHAAPVPTAFAPTPGAFGVTAIQLELKKKQPGEQSSAELTNVLVEQPGPRRVSLLEQKPSPG